MAGVTSTRAYKDALEFKFIPMIPGTGKVPPPGADGSIKFIGYLNNLSYGSSPGWETAFDMGRADPKVMYKAVNRTVNISFKVISEEAVQHEIPQPGNRNMESNFTKLARLGDLTLPIYKSNLGYNAPHVLFSFGKLLSGYGYLMSVDYDWDNETPWIDQRPVITEVQMSIAVLTDFKGNRPKYEDGRYEYFGGNG